MPAGSDAAILEVAAKSVRWRVADKLSVAVDADGEGSLRIVPVHHPAGHRSFRVVNHSIQPLAIQTADLLVEEDSPLRLVPDDNQDYGGLRDYG